MDVAAVRAELEGFLGALNPVRVSPTGTIEITARTGAYDQSADLLMRAQVVEQLLDRVLPDWRRTTPMSTKDRWLQHREGVTRAIAQIDRRADVEAMLGDTSPRLVASALHPWVWDGARSLWHSGHLREAVRAASVKINAETQNRLQRRDLSEVDLFNQAFSDDPASDTAPRLRLPTDDGSPTGASVRRGVRSLGAGLYGAIRNPSSHNVQDELPEQEALEQLAAFSLLARFTDSSERHTE